MIHLVDFASDVAQSDEVKRFVNFRESALSQQRQNNVSVV
jgi:hypothetical protein